jgi:glycolate oxidase FAD binding subunit
MLADGTVAKSGSHAVKSVAGYDVHRFMAGTLGSLAVCLELILRLYPLATKPEALEPVAEMVEVADPTQIRLMKRAKEIFDPATKLNPGVWGFM